jgi:hypothetical protein
MMKNERMVQQGYEGVGDDPRKLIKLFSHIGGQSLSPSINDENKNASTPVATAAVATQAAAKKVCVTHDEPAASASAETGAAASAIETA